LQIGIDFALNKIQSFHVDIQRTPEQITKQLIDKIESQSSINSEYAIGLTEQSECYFKHISKHEILFFKYGSDIANIAAYNHFINKGMMGLPMLGTRPTHLYMFRIDFNEMRMVQSKNLQTIILNSSMQTIEEFETQIDDGELIVINIIATPNRQYGSGWWVNLEPCIFIRPSGTDESIGLVYAFNIPLSPAKHYFKNINDSLRFTLFFPALPQNITHVDIIEDIHGDNSDFNFYNMPLAKIKSEILRH
jgi:hypothetical protein